MAGLTGEVAKLIVALQLDDRGFNGKLNKATKSLGGLSQGFSQMNRGAGQVASGLNTLGTRAAIVAAGGLTAVVTTAASFEQAFTGVEKTVDGTDAQMAKLEETIRAMARSMPVAFEELSAIGEAGGALGIARESLDEFIDVVARLSVSTNLSSDQAATALGQLSNVLHLSGEELHEFGDILVALGNAGASTEDQIVEMAARFAAAGNSAGLTTEEILALSSAVASMGIEVEAGGSSLSRLFNNVATNIGTANDKAVAFADALGISLEEFRASWEKNALGTFQELLDVINELDQFEAAALLKDIGITNTRDVNTIRLMAQNMSFVGEQLQVAEGATGALNKESQKFFDTTIGQWGVLKNVVRDAGYVIGKEILPIVNEQMKDFVGFLAQGGTQSELKNFARDLAGGLRDLVTQIRGADFSMLIGNMKGAAEVSKAAFNAFNALPDPIKQLAIAAIVGNRVTGGAIGDIAAGLGNILGGALKLAIPALSRGISPANPLFVKDVGFVPGGGKGGGPAVGPGGGVGGGLKTIVTNFAALAAIPLTFVAVENLLTELQGARDLGQDIRSRLDNIDTSTLAGTNERLRIIDTLIQRSEDNIVAQFFGLDDRLRFGFESERDQLIQTRNAMNAKMDGLRYVEELNRQLGQRTALASEITAAKNFSPNFNANITNNISTFVSAANVVQTTSSYNVSVGGSNDGGSFIN